MRIKLRVKLHGKKEILEKIGPEEYQLAFKAVPVENQANIKIIEILAKRLHIAKSNIQIIQGMKSRQKTLEISGILPEDWEKILNTNLS